MVKRDYIKIMAMRLVLHVTMSGAVSLISGLSLVSHGGLLSPAGLPRVQISTPLQVNSTPNTI